MEGRVPGGHKKSISGDEISLNDADQQVNGQSQNLKGSENLPAHENIHTETTAIDRIDDKLKDKSKQTNYQSSSPLEIILRNVKKMTHFGTSSTSPLKGKKRSKSLGRSKSLRRENIQTPNIQSQITFGKQVCFEGDKIPGLIGIKNHGNTCFMNAVLQCLSNTELLAQYFVTDNYKQDIRGKSKQNAKKYGTKGELTQNLARLLKSLWTQQYSPTVSSDLKATVGKYGPQYRGTLQHDAQEFLLWLLDKIHEDLNIAAKKKYKTSKNIYGRSDEVAAAEALANHMRCNNSYVYDLFQALYKSSLTCPKCHQQSNTFDPFLCVSLPIPQRNNKPLYVTVVYIDAHPKQVRIGVLMEPSDTVKQLRQTLACDTNIPNQQLILTEIYYDGFHRTFHDSQPLSELTDRNNIYALEVPVSQECAPSDNGSVGANIVLVLLNKPCLEQARRFGGPFVLHVSQEVSYGELQAQILHSMAPMLNEGVVEQVNESREVMFRLRVLDGLVEKGRRCLLPHNVEHPLFMPEVDRALQACVPEGGPEHVKVIIEWDEEAKQRVIGNCDEHVEEHSSVKQVMQQNHKPVTASLAECLQTYTKEERLECDTAWYCPNCRSQQHGTTKAISLWSLPDVFIIHLKRFKQTSVNRSKLETLITFPLTNLDMSKHIAKKPTTVQTVNKEPTGWSPWRPNRKSPSTEADYIYDLYGVVNHYGNMQGGHYTAFCKSAATNKWYSFDDTKVGEMNENDVVSGCAYLLFYQRRTANSCTIYHPDHWLHQVARIRFTDPPKRHSQSQEDLVEDTRNDRTDKVIRNTNPYATMRSGFHKIPVKPLTPSSDIFPSITGSPSMGSLAHVVCAEPGREVRAQSQSSETAAAQQNGELNQVSDNGGWRERHSISRSISTSLSHSEQSQSVESTPSDDVKVGVLVNLDPSPNQTVVEHNVATNGTNTKRRKPKQTRHEEVVPHGYAQEYNAGYEMTHEPINGVAHESDVHRFNQVSNYHRQPPESYYNPQDTYSHRVRNPSESSNYSSSSLQRPRQASHNSSLSSVNTPKAWAHSQEKSSYIPAMHRTRNDSQNSNGYVRLHNEDDTNCHHQSSPQYSVNPLSNPHLTHIYIEDGVNGFTPRQNTPQFPTSAFSPPTPPRRIHLHGSSRAGSTSGSSYDNISVENQLNDQKLNAMLASSSHSTPSRTRVKRPQQHVTAVPKEIKSPDDRRTSEGASEDAQQLDYKQTVYLQESCV